MPRWYALCHGVEFQACANCRRFVGNNTPADIDSPQQAWIKPLITGAHCNTFIERPPLGAITPTSRTP